MRILIAVKEALEDSKRGSGRKNEDIFVKLGPKIACAVLSVKEDGIS